MIAMRLFVFCTLCLLLTPPAWAAEPVSAQAGSPAFETSAERLGKLFDALKRERDPDTARGIAERISREWQDSGSPTVNLLIQWADKAVADDKSVAALDFLDEAIRLRPDHVEGWNRRATLHFKLGNYRKSMSDINRVLAIEPRHFGAIAGMAAIMSQTGRDTLALTAWERFLEIYPSERRAQKELGELAEKLTGQRT